MQWPKGRLVLLDAILGAQAYRDSWADLGGELDTEVWAMTPDTVNAYYSPSLNEMVFPDSIMRPPFLYMPEDNMTPRGKAAMMALSYGGLGAVIGHELTHGFDDQGSESDGEGQLADWWTADVREQFSKRAQCLVDQFSAMPIPGLAAQSPFVRVNGQLTLGENIADAGGLRLALEALRMRLEKDDEINAALSPAVSSLGDSRRQSRFNNTLAANSSPIAAEDSSMIPGLKFTTDQLVVVAFDQIWCTKNSEETARSQAASDPHAPGPLRIVGANRNLPDFKKIFQCSAEAALAPSELGGNTSVDHQTWSCAVW